MEAAVRHLRDGALPDGVACPTCCVLDNLGVVGGALVFRHAFQSFISAMRQGRSQACTIRLADLTGALADVAATASYRPGVPHAQGETHLRQPPERDLEFIDLYSDPWGWRQATAAPALEQPAGSPLPTAGVSPPQPPGPTISLQTLQATLLRPPSALQNQQQQQQQQQQQEEQSAAAPAASMAPSNVENSDGREGSGGGEAPGGGGSGSGGGDGLAAAGSRSVFVVIGCLSTLMERYGAWQALGLLEAVQRSPVVSCVLTSMHTDLHPEQLVFALRRLSSCTLDLSPLTPLQTEVAQQALGIGAGTGMGNGTDTTAASGAAAAAATALAGRLDCRTKRRTGRVKVESELYSILQPPPPSTEPGSAPATGAAATTRLLFHPVPPVLDAPDPKALVRVQPPTTTAAVAVTVAAAGAAPGGAGGGGGGPGVGLLGGVTSAEELARAVGSSMRLTLTEEERRAKQQVVLPYQHQGQQGRAGGALAAAYAAGDHVAYLPPAAGGTGPGTAAAAGRGGDRGGGGGGGGGGLGHILYVRDSGSEADSDQELDEDLDI
ncbi:hypothetical protein PLESTB_001960800 [Pleodorina starrii]|uniref:Elongator complex protein 5 n=1 Tax=Pleodorina starrii TaxID=330485 RepID=A0A9W6C3C7_9CHLO|nr:hypothetical protein PLESTM_002069900 [Pleodorina starrii]GLC62929.1 hypothetical protein PLESTB_001960800 [Pleodorina starrii]GLC70336.1 hypothetical protein PLESTF_000961500 [Pleodorina starrii]